LNSTAESRALKDAAAGQVEVKVGNRSWPKF
jgi:hypothetical protein